MGLAITHNGINPITNSTKVLAYMSMIQGVVSCKVWLSCYKVCLIYDMLTPTIHGIGYMIGFIITLSKVWIHNDFDPDINWYFQLALKHVLAASWQRSQDHEEVWDLIPAPHLDGEIKELRRVLIRDFNMSKLHICVVVCRRLVKGRALHLCLFLLGFHSVNGVWYWFFPRWRVLLSFSSIVANQI